MDSRGMHDSQVQTDASSDEFVLHPTLPSLQEMAYNQIAIAVWYKYRSTPSQRHYGQLCCETSVELELMDCHKLMKTLTMPRFMKENLKKYLKRVRKETIRCYRYFRYDLFSYHLDKYRMRQVDWEYFVWRPDGRIDYKSTAIKMLHSHVLTEVQRFAIMSNFCMENEIRSFDLNRLPMETFIPEVKENHDYLLFYWICYLKNELHSIRSFFVPSYYHDVTLNSLFNSSHRYHENHLNSFEYFWNRSSAEDHVSFISSRLSNYEYYFLDRYRSLFYKMSHYQLTNLLSRQPIAIISLFIVVWEMPEWAIMAWKRCKNWISNEQFVELLESIFNRLDVKPILHRERRMSVLLEIWNTANDHHKNYAARETQFEESVVKSILYYRKKLAPSFFKFLLKFLSLKSADFRKKLILEGDSSFIFHFDFNVVREIFELCLPNFLIGEVEFENEPISYKIRPYFCKILYTEEDHDELNRRLLRCFQNLNISSNDVLKKFIESSISSNKRECETYYPSNGNDQSEFIRFSKFIKNTLQENVSAVLSMKQSYISSFSYNSDPFERYGSLHELSNLIEQEFVHEHLQELKHRFAKILQARDVEQWVWCVSSYKKHTGVFSWCFENEEELFFQVIRSIPINNILVKVLEKIDRRDFSAPALFYNLERFLEWYFSGVAEKVISFKLDAMNSENIEVLKHIQGFLLGSCRLSTQFLQWNWPV